MTPLERALILSYIHNKMALVNLETVVHEMKVMGDPRVGNMQFIFEKHVAACKKSYEVLEKTMKRQGQLTLLENDIEAAIYEIWGVDIKQIEA